MSSNVKIKIDKKALNKVITSELNKRTYDVKCPHCQSQINIPVGISTCPYCHKDIDLNLDIKL